MSPRPRALAALTVHLGLLPSTHMVAQSSVTAGSGDTMPSSSFPQHQAGRQNIHTHKMLFKRKAESVYFNNLVHISKSG